MLINEKIMLNTEHPSYDGFKTNGEVMTHREWLKMLLDGGKGTSSLCGGNGYVFYVEAKCAFMYSNNNGKYQVDISIHKKDLAEHKGETNVR